MNFFTEPKRHNVYKVAIALAKVIDLANWLLL
jgi:hypothetical protein